MNISVKELKEKESSKVEEISWNISNRMRELGNTSVYGGFCLSYVAYLSLKNKINDVYQLVEYVELTFSPERVSFIKGNIENLWNMAIEIGEACTHVFPTETGNWRHRQSAICAVSVRRECL